MRSSCTLIGLIATLVAPALLSAQTYPSAADPRSNLKPGRFDAGTAASNMRLVSFSPKPAQFDSVRGLAFHIAGHELRHMRTIEERYLVTISKPHAIRPAQRGAHGSA